jgi:glucose/arabinose dehydrogenase
LRDEIGRIRDGPDGHLYVLTDEDPGSLDRLEPAD